MFGRGVTVTLCAVLAAGVFSGIASASVIDLTHGGTGYWDIVNTYDSWDGRWDESTLTFTSQTANGDVFDVAGHFYWEETGGDGAYGTEHFIGTFDPVGLNLYLEGQWREDYYLITLGVYDAMVDSGGMLIYDGTWGGSSEWSAQYVPEPATLSLLALGGLLAARRRR